jgi:hypothetical protein
VCKHFSNKFVRLDWIEIGLNSDGEVRFLPLVTQTTYEIFISSEKEHF